MTFHRAALGQVLGWVLLAGCLVPPDRQVFRADIGPEGGTLSGGGLTLDIPAGALAETQTLTLKVTDEALPDVASWSPVYRFEPDGLTFEALVAVEVEVDTAGYGTLWWSRADDPTRYEPVGVAAGNFAAGFTRHFSSAFVGSGSCPVGECACRAGDEQEDLLCCLNPTDLGENTCHDISGYVGADGQACQGYGQRETLETWCSCRTSGGDYLCPEPFEITPIQQCPSEGALNGFHGENDQSCNGYALIFDWQTNTSHNEAASGTLVDCQTVTAEVTWEAVDGTLESCNVPAEGAAGAPGCEDQEDRGWNEECTELLEDLAQDRARNTACADVNPATAGSTIGAAIEAQFRSNGPNYLTQVPVPDANKKNDCRIGGGDGKLDLLRVVPPFDGPTVRIEIAEVKPLTHSGIALGEQEVYDCYKEAVEDAGARCAEPNLTGAAKAFCDAVQANGRPVTLAKPAGLSWEPEDHVDVEIDGQPHEVMVVACEEGVVGYQCVD